MFADPTAAADTPTPAQAAGFYAVAYTVNGVDDIADRTTVISWRAAFRPRPSPRR
ncbi:MAG: hypothetical protein IPL47_14480 [Phyllobacteriaceae bacterium]|nr:hypothetical protein [Phyllobacteriaceae bacterium]